MHRRLPQVLGAGAGKLFQALFQLFQALFQLFRALFQLFRALFQLFQVVKLSAVLSPGGVFAPRRGGSPLLLQQGS